MRASEAKRLLADETLWEVFTLLSEKYHKTFENTPSEDDVSLRRVKLKFELLREFKHELTRIINDQLMEK